MTGFFSENKNGVMNRWFIRLELSTDNQPPPNVIDFGLKSILVNYALYNKKESNERLEFPIKLDSIDSLEKNSIMFDSKGGLPWQVNGQDTMSLEFPITKKEFEETYTVVIWADPFGSTAFYAEGYWRGVVIIKKTDRFKIEEVEGSTTKNIINIKLKIAQSVISYFIDLVEKYTSPNFPVLQRMHDALINGDRSVLGMLGVMAPSIGDNDNSLYATGINTAEVFYGEPGVDLYDGYYWVFERVMSGKLFTIEWGDCNISIYDFKAPIKKLYAEVMRIGNDGRLYSNEGFSNLNWGIVGYQLELGPERMIKFAHMDPSSENQDHDDAATRDGQSAGEKASKQVDTRDSEPEKYPKEFDRRKLFLFITKVISENDLYTYLGVLKHKEDLRNYQGHEEIEKMQNYLNMKILHL
ncbi:hypothetical protein [Rahnella laticis]|uniref:hypothetical protein n=1 Tax=Rahnella laticis TaxID=2787622 RepID=UPI0018A2AE2E|nr:hypothetical protein [Rahnella laticis]MBF7993931.1 hypothetical protein [Rahnella laticis]